jgi:hypothetical protein
MSAIHTALVAALAEMPIVKKDAKNPFLKNTYASLDNIIEAVKPILAKHKLGFFQTVNDNGIETFIYHESGESISSGWLKIQAEQSKGLSIAQSMGVAITYAKRYQLSGMLGISTDDDVDGHVNQPAPTQAKRPLTPDMAEWTKAVEALKAKTTDMVKIRNYYQLTPEADKQLIKEACNEPIN